jgi:PAS domain S-box-containing protein
MDTQTTAQTPFRLLRYFSITSFICIAIVIALLWQLDERTRARELFALGNHNNESLTQTLLITLWPDLKALMQIAPQLSDDQLRSHPQTLKINESAQALVRGGTTAKIKFYNLQGRTLYSSELKQIGQSQAANDAFKAALAGATTTALNHRDSFEVFGKTVAQRDLVSTYLPVRREGNAISAIIELYDDVTPFVTRMRVASNQFLIVTAGILLLLYAVLFLIVRRADGILQRQQAQHIDDMQAVTQAQSGLAQAHEDLQNRETQIRLVNDALPIMIAYVDHNQRYGYVNVRSCEWAKRKREDLIGRTVLEVHGEQVYSHYRADIAKALTGMQVSGTHSHVSRAGKVSDNAYTFIPHQDADGSVAGFYALFQDITEQKNTERVLLAAKSAAETANRAKSHFLANMSHEIRTPMNGVLGMTEMLLASNLPDTEREYARTIRKSGESLLHIINDILDFSKIEAGKLELESIDFNLHDLIRDVMAMPSEQATHKGIQLVSDVAPDVAEGLRGDPTRLRQILTNLLGNALKFTQQGGVTLKVGCVGYVDGAAPRLRFEVIDTGIGIPADALPHLFKAFSQADESTTRRYGGTGLGLAITQQLVELMGGSIGVSSEADRGSTFWFEIPARALSKPLVLLQSQKIAIGQTALRGCRVLLAEDNAVNQAVTNAMLGTLGCGAKIVGNGLQAVEAATAGEFDVILMDCNMPQLDGWEATRRIRAWEAAKHAPHKVPIIALTANALQGDRERCLEAGMDDFLSKPFKREELLHVLARWTKATQDPS